MRKMFSCLSGDDHKEENLLEKGWHCQIVGKGADEVGSLAKPEKNKELTAEGAGVAEFIELFSNREIGLRKRV